MTRTFCFRQMNLIHNSALAKVDIFVVFTTPTFCCQSLRTARSWTFIIAVCNAVTYEVFQICWELPSTLSSFQGKWCTCWRGWCSHWWRRCTDWWTVMFHRWCYRAVSDWCFLPDISRWSPSPGGVLHFRIRFRFRKWSGARSGAGGSGRTSVNGSGLSSLTKSSARGTTTSYFGPCRCRPRVVACLLGSNNGGGRKRGGLLLLHPS